MIGARRCQDSPGSSFSPTCTSASGNPTWNDTSSVLPNNHNSSLSQRPTIRSSRHFIIPVVSAARLPISPTSPRTALRDLCLPRQEPRPPADVLNRSYLSSCSPSLAKFSRTALNHNSLALTNIITPASAPAPPSLSPSPHIHSVNFLHPTIPYLTVNNRGLNHHHYHHHSCRYTR